MNIPFLIGLLVWSLPLPDMRATRHPTMQLMRNTQDGIVATQCSAILDYAAGESHLVIRRRRCQSQSGNFKRQKRLRGMRQ